MRDDEFYVSSFGSLIRCKTISDTNEEEFKKFYKLLEKLFPNLYKVGEVSVFDYAILFKVKGSDPNQKPIMFMNHHDVVASSKEFEELAFSGKVEENKIYGRGTIDTKSGFYCMFQALEELLEEGFAPKQDIYLLSTKDEETSSNGAKQIAQYFKDNNIRFNYILDEGGLVTLDPINNTGKYFAMVAAGEKEVFELKVIAKDSGGHGSRPKKNSAIVRISKFVLSLEKSKKIKLRMSNSLAKTFSCFSNVCKGPKKALLGHAKVFAPIFKLLAKNNPFLSSFMRTTIAFTMCEGGESVNTLPTYASVVLNVRVSKEDTSEGIKNIIKGYADKYNLEIEDLIFPEHTGVSSFSNDAFNNIKSSINEVYPDAIATPYVSATASDSRYLRCVSDNTYGFVPIMVSDEQLDSIHGDNECLDVDNLPRAIKFYKSLMRK